MAIGTRYNELLDAAGVRRVVQRPDRSSVFAQYTVFVSDRTTVQQRLATAGIPTAVHYPFPLNRQPAYVDLCLGKLTPVSDAAAAQVMSLPMHADLSHTQQEAVVSALVNSLLTSG
jgi:UDP-2-acetamido-2-deoxy-ribo-hexuluronate aminotransferase